MSSDRYEIRGKIGQGGVGAVYRAYDTQLRREVAMKRVLQDGDMNSEDATANLLKEATALSSVQHPHIVTVYDAGIDAEGPYVVMELINGKTLDEMVERGTLTFEDFKEVALQSQEAMIAAQDLDLVHRDLKPSNVMVSWLPSGRFQVKLVDFGLAKFSAKPSLQTIDHGDAVFGSIFFMAPEQFERTPLDRRTDMYSLGAMYYYALSGEYPFNGETAPQVMAAHLQNKVAPLIEVRPDLPPWVCDWVMWHIRRDMNDRPDSARAALEHFLAHDSANSFAVTQTQPHAATNATAPSITGNTAPIAIVSPSGQLNPHTAAHNTTTLNPVAHGGQVPNMQTQAVQQAAVPGVGQQGQVPQHGQQPPMMHQAGGKSKSPMLVVVAILLVILIVVVIIMIARGGGEAYKTRVNELVQLVDANDTKKKIGLKDNDLKYLFKGFLNIENKAFSDNCAQVLVRSFSEDGSFNVDAEIAKLATQSELNEDRRGFIFSKIIPVRAISEKKRTEAYPIIISWISENQEHDQVISALEGVQHYLNEADDFPALLDVMATTTNTSLLKPLESALGDVMEETRLKNDMVAQIMGARQAASNDENKQYLIYLVARSGTDNALKMIRSGLLSTDAPTVNRTLRSLKHWPNKKAIPVLTDIIQTTPDDQGIGSKLRLNGVIAVANMLRNVELSGNSGQSLEQDWNKLIELTGNDTELDALLNVMVPLEGSWVKSLMQKAKQKAKNPQLASKIQKAMDNK